MKSKTFTTWLPQAHEMRGTTGFTTHPETGIYTGGGYSVSAYPNRERTLNLTDLDDETLLEAVSEFAADNMDLLVLPNHYVGGWHPHGNPAHLTLDIAVTTSQRTKAEALRVRFGQADFYDFNAGMSRPHNIRNLIGSTR